MRPGSVLVVCETGPDQSEGFTPDLLAVSQQVVAAGAGGDITALVVGALAGAHAADIARYVDEVVVAEQDGPGAWSPDQFLATALGVVARHRPDLVLCGHTPFGMDLAPRLASRLGAPFLSNVVDVSLDDEGRPSYVRPLHKGTVHERAVTERSPSVITVGVGTGRAPVVRPRDAAVRSYEVAAGGIEPPTQARSSQVVATVEPTPGGVEITKAPIVVSAGRGIGDRENLRLVAELADALGGVVACTRPLVDMGWLGGEHQVGLSGRTVRPKLYVACGISGAPEHLAGMRGAETIVAVNTDPGAPIFALATYGIVGDVAEVLPELTEKMRRSAAGQPLSVRGAR